MKLPQETINKLQQDPSCIRNICILAHVDHGKTSLSDSLLATNGIISQRMAGKTRYLDSREDEQTRGITMESSAISLYFKTLRRKDSVKDSDAKESNESDTHSTDSEIREHLINLIDSPGHIDFSSEVSTASRLCDGAIVLVDVVEGVCSQTVNVLRQCWVDKLKPILVLNKIDRLVLEWQLTPLEAYNHLSRLIEQVNSVIGSLYSGERMEDDMIWRELGEVGEYVEKDDSDLYFSPEKNNVIFASAVDGWAFSINTFARFVLSKLGFSQSVLSKTLWGDFYLDMKNKKIIPGKKLKPNQSLKLMFVGLILDQIWAVYQSCIIDRNDEKIQKIIDRLGAKVSPRDLRSKDYKSLLNLIMSQWIPVSHAVLGMVIDYLPSPKQSQPEKMSKLLNECIYNLFASNNDNLELIDPLFEDSIKNCKSQDPDKNTLAYVSKMISVPNDELPKDVTAPTLTTEQIQERSRAARELARQASEAAAAAKEAAQAEEEEFGLPLAVKDPFEWEYEADYFDDEDETTEETLIAFTRVFSGYLSRGQSITIIGPKYDPSLPKDGLTNKSQVYENIIIQDLFLIMGKDLTRMDTVPAGNIVGVVGLDSIVLKNATIISTHDKQNPHPYINLASTSVLIHNQPIMKIAVEPTNLLQLGRLEKGLALLSKADPVFEWYVDDDSGELIMCVAGELHLERCIKDLTDRFAKGCEVAIKEPVIPFREGLDPEGSSAFISDVELSHEVEGVHLDFKVFPLPMPIVRFLIKSEPEIMAIRDSTVKKTNNNNNDNVISQFVESFTSIIEEEGEGIIGKLGFDNVQEFIEHIVSFGPKRIGPNMLVESKDNNNKFKHMLGATGPDIPLEFEPHIVNGFQLAMNEGPLASEPLQGVVTLIKRGEELDKGEEDEEHLLLGQQGRVITATRDLIHHEFERSGARLFLAMYTCEIQAATEALGKVYAVVQKRGGSIVSEDMKEGTPFFTVVAKVPVIEAYGFSEEIRMRTSGAASPQLVFDGFDILDIDPFWVPHTEEELEELGEFAERENIARRYMNNIRRRKGLFVDEKVVQNAEKQRTMKKA